MAKATGKKSLRAEIAELQKEIVSQKLMRATQSERIYELLNEQDQLHTLVGVRERQIECLKAQIEKLKENDASVPDSLDVEQLVETFSKDLRRMLSRHKEAV